MTADAAPSYADLRPRQRRRLFLLTGLRAAVTPVVLLVLYYTLPLDHPLDVGNAVWFVVGFVAFATAVAWQVYSILRSPYPRLRAIEALTVLVPVFLLVFAGTYYLLDLGTPGSFTMVLSRTDALYFTVTTFATVGFGDIVARTGTSRVLVTIQMLADLVLVGLVVKLLVGAVRVAVDRRSSAEPPQAPPQAPPEAS